MNPDHFTVALCSNRNNMGLLKILEPSITLFNERDIRIFVGNADIFFSDTEISDDLSKFLVSIGVKKDQQFFVEDLETAHQVIQVQLMHAKLALTNAAIETFKNIQ